MLLPHLDQRIKKALGDNLSKLAGTPAHMSGASAQVATVPNHPASLPSSRTRPHFTPLLLPPGAIGAAGEGGTAELGAVATPLSQAVARTTTYPLSVRGGAAMPIAPGQSLEGGTQLRPALAQSAASASSAPTPVDYACDPKAGPESSANGASPAAAAAAILAGDSDAAALSPLAGLPPLTDLDLVEEVGEGSGSKVWRGSWGSVRLSRSLMEMEVSRITPIAPC